MNRLIRMLLRQTLERLLADSAASSGAVKAVVNAWQDNNMLASNLGSERLKAEIAIRAFVEHAL